MREFMFTLVSLALAAPALASDGVLEINQTCAVETGCFDPDTAGFPVTITAGGSYRLTSNLNVGANVDGIFVNVVGAPVTIDFNGFALLGPSLGTGTGNGIAGGTFVGATTIKNGAIAGFRARGVALPSARRVRIESMTISGNAGGGAQVGDEARILENTFSANGGVLNSTLGLETGAGALVVENVVSGSGGTGIVAGSGSTLSSNTVYQNGLIGIVSNEGSTVSGNTVYDNLEGIFDLGGSTISGNSVVSNTSSAGISAGSGSIVSGNTVRSNGSGLLINSDAAYRDNIVTGNASGPVSGPGSTNNLGGNFCAGPGTVSPLCP